MGTSLIVKEEGKEGVRYILLDGERYLEFADGTKVSEERFKLLLKGVIKKVLREEVGVSSDLIDKLGKDTDSSLLQLERSLYNELIEDFKQDIYEPSLKDVERLMPLYRFFIKGIRYRGRDYTRLSLGLIIGGDVVSCVAEMKVGTENMFPLTKEKFLTDKALSSLVSLYLKFFILPGVVLRVDVKVKRDKREAIYLQYLTTSVVGEPDKYSEEKEIHSFPLEGSGADYLHTFWFSVVLKVYNVLTGTNLVKV